jgi:hypothetical protein
MQQLALPTHPKRPVIMPPLPSLMLKNTSDEVTERKETTQANKPPAPPKQFRKLSDISSPLGVSVESLNLSPRESEIFVEISTRIGAKLDIFKSTRPVQVIEIDNALEAIQKSTSLDSARPQFDFLRQVEVTLDHFKKRIETINNFLAKNPNFKLIEDETSLLIQDYKNANSYEDLKLSVYNLGSYSNFCNQFGQTHELVNDNIDELSDEEQLQMKEIYINLNQNTFDQMITKLGSIRKIVLEKKQIADEPKLLKNAITKQIEILTTAEGLLKLETLTLHQKTAIKLEIADLKEYDISKKVAELGIKQVEKDLGFYEAAISSLLIKSEVNDLGTEINDENPEFSTGTFAGDLTPEPSVTHVSEEIPTPVKSVEIVVDQPIKKQNTFLKNLQSLGSKLTPSRLIGALTAGAITIATPSSVNQAITSKTPDQFMDSTKTEELIGALKKVGANGQLVKAGEQFPNGIDSVQNLARRRAELTQPPLTETQKEAAAIEFAKNVANSKQPTPSLKVLDAAKVENAKKPEILETINKAEQSLQK